MKVFYHQLKFAAVALLFLTASQVSFGQTRKAAVESIEVELVSFSLPPNAAISLLYGKQKTATEKEMFEKCEALAAKDRIGLAARVRAKSKGRSRTNEKSVEKFAYPVDYEEKSEDKLVPMNDTEEVGTHLEFSANRDSRTGSIDITWKYKRHYAKPAQEKAQVLWATRRSAESYPQLLTHFHVEKLAGSTRFPNSDPKLVGVSFPSKVGTTVAGTGKMVNLTFLRPVVGEKPDIEKNAPETRKDHTARVELVVIELPSKGADKLTVGGEGGFAQAMGAVESGKVKLVNTACLTTSLHSSKGLDVVRETAFVKRVSSQAGKKNSYLTFEFKHPLGTVLKFHGRPPKADGAINIDLDFQYQFHDPVQEPAELDKGLNQVDERKAASVDYKFGTVKIEKETQLESGIPKLIEIVDPAAATEGGKSKDARHLVYVIATMLADE